MNGLYSEDDLKKWTGFEQRQKIEDWLKQNKVGYTYGKGNRLLTTQSALDKALIGSPAAKNNENFF